MEDSLTELLRQFNNRSNSPWENTWLLPSQEQDFQGWIKALPWYQNFQEKGITPELNDPNYDYRKAYTRGIEPSYTLTDYSYHWPTQTQLGEPLKGSSHPTGWMEPYMKYIDKDPDAFQRLLKFVRSQ